MKKKMTVSGIYTKREKNAPYIRISGQWLKEAGIEYGAKIKVVVNRSGIKITPIVVALLLLAGCGGPESKPDIKINDVIGGFQVLQEMTK